jgi:hypothetical protein
MLGFAYAQPNLRCYLAEWLVATAVGRNRPHYSQTMQPVSKRWLSRLL